ncbi:ParB/RepB/Spo0J family partition protein [Streptomyces sp. NPDC090052]|uniref:ParB/RepB/Spo0J family partition protein n=1 Tax=Streptomyces sp. NPDC090052 TaxID=3365931 RepID=UPI00382962E5
MTKNDDDFLNFLGDGSKEGPSVVDTKAEGRLLRVPLGRLATNLVNPRSDFGTKEQLEDFGRSLKRRQLHAIPVVSRSAYLTLWPDHRQQVGSVDFVIVSGERRFRAATAVGMQALECVINDSIAESQKTFMDAVVSENIDRQNFDHIEEAHAVQALVTAFGTARAVAQHYERADGWVSQRRVLLELAPSVQDLVRNRDLPLEPARKLGKLTKDNGWGEEQQLSWWEAEQESRRTAAAARKAARAEAKRAAKAAPKAAAAAAPGPGTTPPASLSGALPSQQGSSGRESEQEVFTAVKTENRQQDTAPGGHPAAGPPLSSPGEPPTGTAPGTEEAQKDEVEELPHLVMVGAVPWGDPQILSQMARQWMTAENLETLAKLLAC